MQTANAAEGGGAFAYDGAIGPQAWPGEECRATLPYSLLQSCQAKSAAAFIAHHLT